MSDDLSYNPVIPQENHYTAADNVARAIGDALTNVPLINGAWCASNDQQYTPALMGGARPVSSEGSSASLMVLQHEMDRGVMALKVCCPS